jgi:ATP-binding cassette subfamily G (WHITE) protein 2 (SNQ2)
VALANQACPLAGYDANTGLVNGLSYLRQTYNYEYSHLWRNFGILLVFWAGFFTIQTIATEYQKDEAAAAAVVLFKRGKAPKELANAIETSRPDDEEVGKAEQVTGAKEVSEDEQEAAAEDTIVKPKEILTWRNVSYDIKVKDGHRRLLDNISGYVAPGKMVSNSRHLQRLLICCPQTALMGESGAGKTTLLNVLAQRVTMGVVEGDILVNGHELPASFQRACGYVHALFHLISLTLAHSYAQQQDVHLQQTTVREALQFSALLRQPRDVPKQEKLDYVEEVIKLLEVRCANSL